MQSRKSFQANKPESQMNDVELTISLSLICLQMSSKTAADLILSLSGRVTIISRPQETYALTIALCQKKNWWSKVSSRAGLPAVASPVQTYESLKAR